MHFSNFNQWTSHAYMYLNSTAIQLLEQLAKVTGDLGKHEFTTPLSLLSGASIGQHVRHTIEFFLCLLETPPSGTLNYDLRKHDELIEQNQQLSLSILYNLIGQLEKCQNDYPLTLEASYDLKADCLATMGSSFNRELAYNIEHAIHHMALMKVGILHAFPEISLPTDFGFASSTLRYQLSQSR